MLLASVVRSAKVQTYTKVDDDHLLTLLHKKFWGKSMEEEAEWQKTQTQIGGQPKDKDQHKYDAMEEDQDQDKGKGKGKATGEGGEGKPDEDEGEETDEDDDLLPGCHVLDTGIKGRIIWIRADYIRIFDFCQTHYDKYVKLSGRLGAPSVVLTGQPGIGKSFWIYYAARRLLAENTPFIWFFQGYCYLFVDDGVYKLPPDWEHTDFKSIIWTLVDTDQSRTGVPEIFIPHGTQLFVIYVTFPAADRWSRMDKTTRMVVVIMNPWSRREIQRVAHLSPLKEITEDHVNEIFDQLGPIPRLCIDRASNQLAAYKTQLHNAISNITMDDIWRLTNEASRLTMDGVSDKICVLSRQDRDVVDSRVVVAPITKFIKSRLSNQFRNLQRAEQLRLYQLFTRVPKLRMIAEIFHEVMGQNHQNDRRLEILPTVKPE